MRIASGIDWLSKSNTPHPLSIFDNLAPTQGVPPKLAGWDPKSLSAMCFDTSPQALAPV